MLIIYVILAFAKPDALMPSLKFFLNIIIKIIPIFILIFILMIVINRFVSTKKIMKYFGKKAGVKAWLAAVITGIISAGPIYLWYPLLYDLQKKGVRNGLIATFLYNRAVKLPLLPLMILYFGITYVIVLSLVMMIASVFQGLIVEKIMEVNL
ncbi:hypothetical protein KY348_06235 [Candidatus Woesearchaeota archaeon]|nr:hypothetical protein [Candidatus Woesearchaeota archaeon]